jgi:hypothetical protein
MPEAIDTYCKWYGAGCPDKVSGVRCKYCQLKPKEEKEKEDGYTNNNK